MPIFEYEALDPQGKAIRGTQFGQTAGAVEATLAARGFSVHVVRAAGVAPAGAQPPVHATSAAVGATAPFPGAPPTQVPHGSAAPAAWNASAVATSSVASIKLATLGHFFAQFSTLLDAGLGPVETFDLLLQRTRHPVLRDVVQNLKRRGERAESLAEGLEEYPGAFTPYMRAMALAGERGGYLPQSLAEVARIIDNELALRRQLRIVTFYPKALFAFAILIVLFINNFASSIIGRGVYNSFILEWSFWRIAGPVLLGIFVFFKFGLKTRGLKTMWDHFLSVIPFFGSLARGFALAKFGQTFAAMYRSGIIAADAVRYAAASSGNAVVENAVIRAEVPMRQGQGIAASLSATQVMPNEVIQMIATGERTGRLDEMLDRMSSYYEKESEVLAKQAAIFAGILALVIVVLIIASMLFGALGNLAGSYREVTSGIEQ